MTDVKLYLGDCLEVMRGMPENSVDFCFADPPFNIGKRYSAYEDKREDYYEWQDEWVGEVFRVLKDTGSVAIMTITKHLEKLFPSMGSRGVFISQVIWRNVSANHNNKGFWMSYQPVLLYGKTENYKFNKLAELRKVQKENQRWGGYTTGPIGYLLDYWDDIPFVYAGSIHHKEAILTEGTNKKAHPCQMPTALAGRFIDFCTDPGDTVLDPFVGSGTTLASCVLLNRNGIGIEIDPTYFAIAEKRIAEAQMQPRLI